MERDRHFVCSLKVVKFKFVKNIKEMFLVQDRSLMLQTEGIKEVNSEIIINLFYGSLEKFKTSIEGLRITNFKEKSILLHLQKYPKAC